MPISHRQHQPGVFEERTAISGEGGGMEQKGNGATFKDTNLIVVVRDLLRHATGYGSAGFLASLKHSWLAMSLRCQDRNFSVDDVLSGSLIPVHQHSHHSLSWHPSS